MPATALALGACGGYNDTADTSLSSTTTSPDTASTPATDTTATPVGSWVSGRTDLITVAYPATAIFPAATTCQVSLTTATN